MNRIKIKVVFLILLLCISGQALGSIAGYVCNKGVAGNSSSDLLARMDRDVIDLNPDLVVVMVGTNDLLNSKKMVSVAEFISNLEQLTKSLSRHGINVVLVSSPPVDSKYLFERHNATLFALPPNSLLKRAGEEMQVLCKKEGYLFIDAYNFFRYLGIPRHNEDDIIRNARNSGQRDGVHFTKEENALLARLIFEKLTGKYSSLDELKIICFGDSFTYGAYMDGKGTASGNTYPAEFKKYIN